MKYVASGVADTPIITVENCGKTTSKQRKGKMKKTDARCYFAQVFKTGSMGNGAEIQNPPKKSRECPKKQNKLDYRVGMWYSFNGM